MKNQKQLILNPVENLPYLFADTSISYTHGLYVSDKKRQMILSEIQK